MPDTARRGLGRDSAGCDGFAAHVNCAFRGFILLYGAYQGTFRAMGKALATDLVPQRLRASGVGLYASTVGLSALIASVVGG